jgi:glutaredoxin
MKSVKVFYLKDCPFCRKAFHYIDELQQRYPELADVTIERIEESEQQEFANRYDYYYVPTFYIGEQKMHEGGIFPDEVEQILRQAVR